MPRRNVTITPDHLNTILPTFKQLARVYPFTTIVLWDNGARLCLRCGYWTTRGIKGTCKPRYAECTRCGLHCYDPKHKDGLPPWSADRMKFSTGMLNLDSPVYRSPTFKCVHCGNVITTVPNRRATKFFCPTCGLRNNINTVPAENWIEIPSLKSYDSIRLQTHDFK